MLTDGWFLFNVGSTKVHFSEEEAITIAVEFLDDFSWDAAQNGELVKVTDFNILEEPISVELLPHIKKTLELIP